MRKLTNFEAMLFAPKLRIKLMNMAKAKTFGDPQPFDAAKDLVQDTYLKALERQKQFSGDKIDPWVVTILKNNFKDSKKKETYLEPIKKDFDEKNNTSNLKPKKQERKQRRASLGDIDEPSVLGTQESAMLANERNEIQHFCFKQLKQREREIISMSQTMKYKEISEDLDISYGNIRKIVHDIKEKHAICMEQNYG